MRDKLPEKIEAGRIRSGRLGSNTHYGPYGLFRVIGPCGSELVIMASAGDLAFPWEHVSVSIRKRTPNWQEMCWVKDQFWHDEECCIQFHPPKREYVNNHSRCLHLWRPHGGVLTRPPAELVGDKKLGVLT